MFQHQKQVLLAQMEQLQHTIDMVEYKCWFYETAKEAGTTETPQKMDVAQVPERFRKIRQELRKIPRHSLSPHTLILKAGSVLY